MGWWTDFLDRVFPVTRRVGGNTQTVIVNIPAELYYVELAVHTAVSLISNAISRSEIKVYIRGRPEKTADYFLLNVSPNANESSPIFWHRAINQMVRKGESLIVEAGGRLYVADSFVRKFERPVLGDVYEAVTVGTFTFNRTFGADDVYLLQLDDVNTKSLINNLYETYGKILSAADRAFRATNATKYVLHIEGTKAGDDDFNEEFQNYISKQLKDYMQADTAVYPEFDGYKLGEDPASGKARTADDYIKLREGLFEMVANAFHIPHSMIEGNVNNFKDVVGSFISFGVDPYADAITKSLNKRGGADNFQKGNYYKVDTSRIIHRDLFEAAADVANLISSGTLSPDEVREELGRETLNEPWSRAHYMTKNFDRVEQIGKGGEET